MCGFVTTFEANKTISPDLLKSFSRDLFHRGPDSNGIINQADFSMVFRRLSILDLNRNSDQPMQDISGRYFIVFNGEIYNYLELRNQLIKEGVIFKSNGDAEVILNGYIKYGNSIVDKLEGMFAFVIYDSSNKNIIAARDPFGIKPLYFSRKGNLFAFSSEARPLRRLVGTEIDPTSFYELLIYRHATGRTSNYKNIELIPGGTLISIDLNNNTFLENKFFSIKDLFNNEDSSIKEDNAIELVQDNLVNSITSHMNSDVGFSIQLSGGIDSSLITAISSKIRNHDKLRTYGISIDDELNEATYRKIVIDKYKVNHHEIQLSEDKFTNEFESAVRFMEGPVPHFGCVMLKLLCKEISKTDKVVLTGEGADEFFGGYARYSEWKRLKTFGILANSLPDFTWDLFPRYNSIRRYSGYDSAVLASVYFDVNQINNMFPGLKPSLDQRELLSLEFKDYRNKLRALDQTAYLSSLLLRQDKMSMASSVEARVPFTHLPLAKLIHSIPLNLLIPGNSTKPILKKAARKWLPDNLIFRRKVGLTLPLHKWLSNENGFGRYIEYLLEPNSKLSNYGDFSIIKNHVLEFKKQPPTHGIPIVAHLINMELWLRSLDDDLLQNKSLS
jgi:asparagine synthase (glutamine-hydrolysing)